MPGINVVVTHPFVSAKSDGPDITLVRPSNWNANLKLGGASGGHRLIRDPSQTDGAAWVEPATVRLTNRTGGTHTVGDVVVLDSVNDSSVAASTTQGSLKKVFVALEANGNTVAGIYAAEGPVTAKAQGIIARHQYVRLSATTGAVEDAGAAMTTGTPAPLGAVGVALSAAAAGVVVVYLFAFTVGGPPITAGYIKGTGTGYSTQATPLPAADLGSGGGGAGALFLADNQTWKAIPSPILNKTGSIVTVTSTVAETSIYSFSVPGNTIGSIGKLRLTLIGTVTDSSAASTTLTWRVKFGAVTLWSTVHVTGDAGGVSIGTMPFRYVVEIGNKSNTADQIAVGVLESVGLIVATAAATLEGTGSSIAPGLAVKRGASGQDTTLAQTLQVTVQWNAATASRAISMEHAVLELL